MALSLIVVTPHASFGELVRQSLEETGAYRVQVLASANEAVSAARAGEASMALLDLDLGEADVISAAGGLRAARPDISLVILSGDETPPPLDPIRPWTLLQKPFYLPDLLGMLSSISMSAPEDEPAPAETALPAAPAESPAVPAEDLPWLRDVTRAAQHLTRLTLESSAQAALLARGGKLWAYAGGLSQEAGKELAALVTRSWDNQRGGDLLRFARLEATKAEHMLYASRLDDDLILALVFDAETPFSTIRAQAGKLARSLSGEQETARPEASAPAPAAPAVPAEPGPAPAVASAEEMMEEDIDLPSIAEILLDVPAPDPEERFEVQVPTLGAEMSAAGTVDPGLAVTRPSVPAPRAQSFSHESSPAIRLGELSRSDGTETDLETPGETDIDATMPSRARRPSTPRRAPQPGEIEVTRPSSITEAARRVILEPTSPALYNLTYACLLVPRFASHYLTGDLAVRLAEWLPNICVAFGWRLEFMAVRPEYLQWVVNVPPSTSPGYLMRIMRQQTSERIFADFGRLKKENPSGDFWAPGYLIMGGTQPHPPQLVRDYLKQTRQRQGL